MKDAQYTAVQHSGFGYGQNLQFVGGLESRPVTTSAQRKRVISAGGLLFDSYIEAESFCEWAMYEASSVVGLIPRADLIGGFSAKQIDGLRIFRTNAKYMSAFRESLS